MAYKPRDGNLRTETCACGRHVRHLSYLRAGIALQRAADAKVKRRAHLEDAVAFALRCSGRSLFFGRFGLRHGWERLVPLRAAGCLRQRLGASPARAQHGEVTLLQDGRTLIGPVFDLDCGRLQLGSLDRGHLNDLDTARNSNEWF
jgi:hypothetical protein